MGKNVLEEINQDINNINVKVSVAIKFAETVREESALKELKEKLFPVQNEFVKKIENICYKKGDIPIKVYKDPKDKEKHYWVIIRLFPGNTIIKISDDLIDSPNKLAFRNNGDSVYYIPEKNMFTTLSPTAWLTAKKSGLLDKWEIK